MEKVEYSEKIFELNKDKVFEKDIESHRLMLYSTLSNRDKVDNDMQNIETRNKKFTNIFHYTRLHLI